MDIGIIVYSQTGNTTYVAGELKKELTQKGHQVEIEKIEIEGVVPAAAGKFTVSSFPEVEKYDFVIFGSPVQAFSLNPVMSFYLENLSNLQGKEVALYVTKRLPVKWTGGTQALGKMKNLIEDRGGEVKAAAMIFWSDGKRDQMITQLIETVSKAVKSN